jgi:hypothetical protein
VLRKAVQAHSRQWIEIVERYFPERTPIQAKNRYFTLSPHFTLAFCSTHHGRYKYLQKAALSTKEADESNLSQSHSCVACDRPAWIDTAPSFDGAWLSNADSQVFGNDPYDSTTHVVQRDETASSALSSQHVHDGAFRSIMYMDDQMAESLSRAASYD